MPTRIVWYKPTDLRLHDHGPLWTAHIDAIEAKDNVLHVLVLDPLLGYGPTAPLSRHAQLPRIGRVRAKFLVEAIQDLHRRLQAHGHSLLVHVGVSTVSVFQQLEIHYNIAAVYTHGPEFCSEEQTIERGMKQVFGKRLKLTWGWTLHHPEDLAKGGTPFRVPERYKDFLQLVCRNKRSTCFRNPGPDEPLGWASAADIVHCIPGMPKPMDCNKLDIRDIVRPEAIGNPRPDDNGTSDTTIRLGGETAALQAMHQYIWDDDRLRHYVGSSDSMTPGKHNALNSTTGLSAYLAMGCLSPRTLYAQVLQYEKTRTRNRSTYWVFHELVFRDFFVFWGCHKWKTYLFRLNGPNHGSAKHPWRKDGVHARKLFDLWKTGRTGYPMVDAGMRQLAATGQMPHLVRQMVAGFLVRDLRLDWRWGAEWFEYCLLDYTPDANYGNWAYRILPLEQLLPLASKHLTSLELVSWPVVHDPHLEYTLTWVPELRTVWEDNPDEKVLVREPWRLDANYAKGEPINVTPCKDSPLWIMSVNRSNWPEYQQMMTGKAWTLQWKSKRIGGVVDAEKCPYAYPIVAPVELEILYDKIPLDHSWGDDAKNVDSKNNGNRQGNNNGNRNSNGNRNRRGYGKNGSSGSARNSNHAPSNPSKTTYR